MVVNKVFSIDCFGITDIGLVRQQNEDAWAAYPDLGLFILADGMGGHAAGEIAAKEAVEYLSMLVSSWMPTKAFSEEEAMSFFEQALSKVNHRIYEEGQHDEKLRGMGTTLCVLYVYHDCALLAHVGDSRIYRLRDSTLEQLTEDHSLVNEMVAIGAMKPEESETFLYKHILTRAVGTQSQVEPTIRTVEVKKGDLFLLCSDGLTNFVDQKQICEILQNKEPLSRKGQGLVDLANKLGGADNISVILVVINHDLS